MKVSKMKDSRTVNTGANIERRIKVIEEYYNELNPPMSYKEFETICKTPFKHMRDSMLSGSLYEFRFKYFGNFRPAPSTVVWILKKAKEKYDKGLIDNSEYNKHIMGCVDYISKNPAKFTRYTKELKPWIDITQSVT